MSKQGASPRFFVCLFGLVLCSSCDSSNSASSSRTRVCTPGEQRACACPGGIQGIQICNAEGTLLGDCSSCPDTMGAAGSAGKGGPAAAGNVSTSGAPTTEPGSSGGAALTLGGTAGTSSVALGGSAGAGANRSADGGMPTSGTGGVSPSSAGTANSGQPTMGGTTTGGSQTGGGTSSLGGAAPIGGTGSPGGTSNSGTNMGGNSSIGGAVAAGGAVPVGACGDGIVNYNEGCDPLPKNNDFGDGCTPACAIEPSCVATGGACASRCGDGFAAEGEACDDGNAVSGDGCSATCAIEDGFDCNALPPPERITIPMVVRDFDLGGDFEKGGAFALDLNYANQGLLNATLDDQGQRPVLAATTGTYNGTAGKDSGIASAASFAQWFNDAAAPAGNKYHATLVTSLTLFLASDGSRYANRFGVNGDGATNAAFNQTTWEYCGNVGKEDHDALGNAIPCSMCLFDEDPSTPQCDPPDPTACQTDPSYIECTKDGSMWRGIYLKRAFDGNPLFFPADPLTPANPASTAQISGNYDPAWPTDPTGKIRNFSFTTETRFWFKYDAAKTYSLKFEGDDDAWVFVNKHLAVDLGGIHVAVHGELTLANGVASTVVTNTNPSGAIVNLSTKPDLGTLQDGGLYEVAVFQAERQTKASSYMLSISSEFTSTPSVCHRK